MKKKQTKLTQKLNKLFNLFIRPRSHKKDSARREYILNVLLLGAIILSIVATVTSWISLFIIKKTGFTDIGVSPYIIVVILVIFLLAYHASRNGHFKSAAFTLIFVFFLAATYTAYVWGGESPQGLLTYALVIVMAGILINSKVSFIFTFLTFCYLVLLIPLQQHGFINVENGWRLRMPGLSDALVYGFTIWIIYSVSWLFNREIERALKRAQQSEKDLRKERDLLELRIEQRTQQLREAQIEKMVQLYRFAEFGRIASGLFHDLANPLNLVSLNLDKLQRESTKNPQETLSDMKFSISKALIGTRQMEDFIKMAQTQMQSHDIVKSFSINKELRQVISMLGHKTKQNNVRILIKDKVRIMMYGNPIKFNQFITNLLLNAIDSYDSLVSQNIRQVVITVKPLDKQIMLTIQDWGCGIENTLLTKIFKPFFTTKTFEKGTGLGLSITKDIIEKDFRGTIHVESKKDYGTTFKIILPRNSKPRETKLTYISI